MSKFTQGKWTSDGYGCYVFAHEEQMMICQMRGWAYLKDEGLSDEEAIEVQEANARLIAAAPEMYKLLVTILNDTQDGHKNELIALLNVIDGQDIKDTKED